MYACASAARPEIAPANTRRSQIGSKAVVMAPVVSDSEFFSHPMTSTLSNMPEPTRWYPPIATVQPGGPARGQLDDRLHRPAGAVDAPAVDVVDALEMVHVADDDRVDVLHLQVGVLEGPLDGLVDQLLAVHVGAMAFMECLSCSYYCNSFGHGLSSYLSLPIIHTQCDWPPRPFTPWTRPVFAFFTWKPPASPRICRTTAAMP